MNAAVFWEGRSEGRLGRKGGMEGKIRDSEDGRFREGGMWREGWGEEGGMFGGWLG